MLARFKISTLQKWSFHHIRSYRRSGDALGNVLKNGDDRGDRSKLHTIILSVYSTCTACISRRLHVGAVTDVLMYCGAATCWITITGLLLLPFSCNKRVLFCSTLFLSTRAVTYHATSYGVSKPLRIHSMEFKPPATVSFNITGKTAEIWLRWVQQFRIYVEAAELATKPPKTQVAILLHCAGPEAQDIFTNFVFANTVDYTDANL